MLKNLMIMNADRKSYVHESRQKDPEADS
jgi:hypothetical protein